ncbi:MAG: sensor histidine kinase [Dysosmobacter sp.]|nr:sensor histidine kinase [Dysosmobacter sp.]
MENDDLIQLRTQLLSHLLPEISTHLRYAMGNLHFAAAALAPASAREEDPSLDTRAAILDQSYYRLLRLVNNLSVAAYMNSEEPFPLQDRDIVGLVENICDQCRSLAKLLDLDFSFQCEKPSYVCAVSTDPLEQLVFQLLSNAFKFTPKGGKVTVELKFSAKRVLLTVADTGCGIPEELRSHLFDRYLQKDLVTMPPHGLGLGLLLCQLIAHRHSGSMMAESREGKGTRITLSIPDRQMGVSLVEDQPFDYAGGFNRTLLGLADALPAEAFLLRNQE